ncbi:MAG: chromosome segregation protein SMC [Butyricicoccus pullicaecorum]|nr:chromosome segregation protein SMC [Butyricicoccus pullicaecorum]
MILKSLILQGFKSFPDRTEIRFAGGMTAIVGPNGSGKSNISDAIRWVLGEQSTRSLRGAKMEDVIFSGTQKRRPVGFAEVSLILDNAEHAFRSDYTEIMVTRRYYRSGESEYALNKKPCRLKDIHELFMDTGLGRDGYSIIGQGRIDEILSLKSEDRREIFEEAAGITKFRYRKEEANRKLEATEENLVRIRDLYTELAHQAQPLAEQAEKAKQYMGLRDELRTLEVSLWLEGLTQIRVNTEKNQQDTAACAEQLQKARTEQDRLYAQSEQLTKELRDADTAADTLRQQMHATEQNRANLSSQCAVLEANLKNNAQNRERIQKEQARQNEQERSLAGQAAVHLARQAELTAACEALAQSVQHIQLEDARAGAQAEGLQRERSAIDERKAKNEQARFAAELARTAAKTGLSGMDSRKEQLAAELEQAAAQLAEQTAACKISENKLETCRKEQETLKNQRAGMTLKIERRQTKVQDCVQTLADITAKQTDIENRIKMLRELEKDYEGFSRAVKRVMQQADSGKLAGIHGPVSSCLTVESRYVTAIEIALGAAGSHLIVDTAMDGKAAIAYLKRTDSGRATFLPLDTIRAKLLGVQGLDTCAGVCGTADTLISCAPEYQTVMQSLLARTVIAEDIDAALALAKKYQNHFRIVTLDGQMIQAGGAMTGGSVSKTSGVLARTAQLHTLTEQAEQLKAAQRAAEHTLEQARTELSQVQYEQEALEQDQERQQERLTVLQTETAQYLARMDSLRTHYENLSVERDNLDTARVRYEQEIASAQETLEACAREQEILQTASEQIQERLDDWTQAQKMRMTKIHQLHTAQAENRAEFAAEQRAAEDLERLRADMAAGADNSAQMMERLEQEAQSMQEQLAQAGNLRDSGADDLKRLQELLAAQAQQRMRIEAQRTQVDRRAQDQNEEILGLERENVRLSAQGVQLKNEEAQILDKMWESYELTPTPAQAFRIELSDRAAALRTAEELRSQLRALGNVNLDAVEAYTALKERFLFLEEQKEDLETAQKELQTVIDELTVHMKEIFATEFAKLNHYFGQTFTEIFGGGHAQLELADTADILNCGIEIRVCPPGKAVKTLTLLSGGEKAFVAIALYFAILKVRPTPFCVLDEIEAALDDVNVARYAQYLRKLSGATQFIAITHRRGTMEQADMLYGVTMQEQGVSRMLMLNLAEAEEKFQGTIN